MIRSININGVTELGYHYIVPTNRDEAWALIQQERELRMLHGGYKVNGYWFHSDLISRSQQMGLLLLGDNIPSDMLWKSMSREKVPLNPILARSIFLAAVASDSAIFDAGEAKMMAAEASSSYETFDYFSGWPQAYWEVQS